MWRVLEDLADDEAEAVVDGEQRARLGLGRQIVDHGRHAEPDGQLLGGVVVDLVPQLQLSVLDEGVAIGAQRAQVAQHRQRALYDPSVA